MAFVGDMIMEGLAKGIDENADAAIDSAKDMTKDLNSVFDGLGGEIFKTPIDFNVDAVANGAIPSQAQGESLRLELHIDTFINNTSEDKSTNLIIIPAIN